MKAIGRWLLLLVIAVLGLQLFFILRIALMAVVDPQSSTFERSEAWRIATQKPTGLRWRQEWTPYARISDHLKRAVITSEDDSFVNHDGVDWEAIEKAWQRNAKAEAEAARRAQGKAPAQRAPKIVGGSTITQQLAKNLLLSGERTFVRKSQEMVLTFALETFLTKERILEIYLNHVEWGEGVFGAEAAARHYFGLGARELGPEAAARLASFLPSPKRYGRLRSSPYLDARTAAILRYMPGTQVP
jgi:monofunctional biosynthetic peptidoglycan transglycosylase